MAAEGRLPDSLVACIGGGSNAMGLFHPFLDDPGVEIFGVEAAATGSTTGQHAASLTGGRPGVLHGNRTYLLQDDDGQITEGHSISAGLDYPGIGPEHSWLQGHRPRRLSVGDRRRGARRVPALLASSRASSRRWSRRMRWPRCSSSRRQKPKDHLMVMNMCGRGDKDIFTVADHLGSMERMTTRIDRRFAALAAERRAGLVTFVTAGDPDPETSLAILKALPAAGADLIELGMPFTDPMADGPAIQAAGPARAQGRADAGQDARPGARLPRAATTPRRSC